MHMERITSLQNAKVKGWVKLHEKKERDKTGLFLIEGEHLISEALKKDLVVTIITDKECPFDHHDIIYVTEAIMDKIAKNISHVHIMAVCKKVDLDQQEEKRVILLDNVQDPGNLGTIVRTAVAFNYDSIYCSKNTVDIYNEKVIRSTQGALFHIPVIYTDLPTKINELKQNSFHIIATSLHEAKPMQEIQAKDKMVFIMGNEGQGVSKELLDISDEKLFIEMPGFESLNVAVAAGIVMYKYQQ